MLISKKKYSLRFFCKIFFTMFLCCKSHKLEGFQHPKSISTSELNFVYAFLLCWLLFWSYKGGITIITSLYSSKTLSNKLPVYLVTLFWLGLEYLGACQQCKMTWFIPRFIWNYWSIILEGVSYIKPSEQGKSSKEVW